MKKLLSILFLLAISVSGLPALNISAGTYYFDNSKTRYVTVQFLYGTDSPSSHTIINLTDKGNDIWELAIPSTIANTYRYTFTHTVFPVGTFNNKGFSAKKDEVSSGGYYRTATTGAAMSLNGTFVPDNGNNWAQGKWVVKVEPSGTLPIFYLNTQNKEDITSKDYYVSGGMYIDTQEIPGYTSSGTEQTPIVSEFKGRGNYTWKSFNKKPYRIKMNSSAKLLNMTKDKSYNLLAHADDPTFLRNAVGFELSKMMEFTYTPSHEPIELVKNGEYWGLYFLTEHIKVSNNRVNIVEQADNETNPELVTGGWLIEIDNYPDDNQVSTARVPRFTIKSPEILSSLQDSYIRTYLQKTEDAIYINDKNSVEWEEYIDLNTLVDFYIIQEIVGNTESFNGSCYFTKDKGEKTKIMFGPVWDFGNAYRHGNKFIYQDIAFSSHWLPEIVKFPRFQERLIKRWSSLRYTKLPEIFDRINEFKSKIDVATRVDYARWPEYGSYDYNNDVQSVINYITNRIAWLDTKWYDPTGISSIKPDEIEIYPNPTKGNLYVSASEKILSATLYSLEGKLIARFTNIDDAINLEVQNGNYLLRIQTNNNTISKMIIVKK